MWVARLGRHVPHPLPPLPSPTHSPVRLALSGFRSLAVAFQERVAAFRGIVGFGAPWARPRITWRRGGGEARRRSEGEGWGRGLREGRGGGGVRGWSSRAGFKAHREDHMHGGG